MSSPALSAVEGIPKRVDDRLAARGRRCKFALIASVFLLLVRAPLSGQSRTAALVAHGKSAQLLPSNPVVVPGVGNVTTYFTTFNGATGTPLVTSSGIVSGELRPRASTPGLYEGGYAQATPLVVYDYGSYAVTLPTSDADANGIPDVLQFDRDGTFTATGSGFSVAANLTFSMSVRFSRSAGAATGTYTATTQNAAGQTNTVNGVYDLLGYQGTVSYTRGSTNSMTISATILSEPNTTLNGSTTYTVTNADQISYSAFTIRSNAGTTYQVRAGTLARSGNVYHGNFSLADGLPQTPWADFTEYVLAITDSNDGDGNGIPDFSDPGASPPIVSGGARTQAVTAGQSVTLSATVTGATSYQWAKNGATIPGATSASLTLSNVQPGDAGSYTITAINASGSVTSAPITLTVTTRPTAPAFAIQPRSFTVTRGSMVILSCEATGTPVPTLQWRKDGISLAGATNNTLQLAAVGTANTGVYTCIATNSVSSVTSQSAVITLSDTSDVGRLVNLSIRTNAGTGATTLITGFSIAGPTAKPILVRAAGPSLGQFGITNAVADPVLTLYAGADAIASNDNWAGDAQLGSVSRAVGAFGFTGDTSKDAAVFVPALTTGSYTAQIAGAASSTGLALAEIYDATPAGSFTLDTSRLTNVSARANVGTGGDILIAGFVIGGTTARTLLVRAIGPTLASFGVTGVLVDPKLELFAGTTRIATNDDWGGAATLVAAATSVGAFALSSASKDAVLMVTLPPGSYSAQMSGVGNTAGVGLIELYEIPNSPVPQTPATPVVPAAGLVAYFPFEGNTTDQSGSGLQATLGGNTQYVTGASGRGLRIIGDNALFYSNGGHVRLPAFTTALNAGFSLSVWVKDESLGGQPVNEEAYISFGALDLPKAEISLNSVTRSIGFNMDTGRAGESRVITRTLNVPSDYAAWKHLVLTYSPGTMTAYFNGEKIGQQSGTFNVFPAATAALGRHWWNAGASSSARMSATFDNVRIYGRALSEVDILNLYLAERP